jgi:hypothetical protein
MFLNRRKQVVKMVTGERVSKRIVLSLTLTLVLMGCFWANNTIRAEQNRLPQHEPHAGWQMVEWGRWTAYPDGETTAGPAAAVFQDRLYTMIRGTDNRIYVKTGLRNYWEKIDGETLSNPALAVHNGNLYALVRGTDNRLYLNRLEREHWEGWRSLGRMMTSSGGALASCNGRLYVAARGNDNRLYINTLDSNGRGENWTRIDGLTLSEPALTAFRGRLYLAIRGMNNHMYIRN